MKKPILKALGGIGAASLTGSYLERARPEVAIPFLVIGCIACALYYYLMFKNRKNTGQV